MLLLRISMSLSPLWPRPLKQMCTHRCIPGAWWVSWSNVGILMNERLCVCLYLTGWHLRWPQWRSREATMNYVISGQLVSPPLNWQNYSHHCLMSTLYGTVFLIVYLCAPVYCVCACAFVCVFCCLHVSTI